MLEWIRRWLVERGDRQAKALQLVEDDARALMSRHGATAYYTARAMAAEERQGRLIEIDRPSGHWSKVRLRIGELTGLSGRADSATRRLYD